MTNRSERVERLFAIAVDLPPVQRPGFLERECGENTGLLREIERLLALDDSMPETYLTPPAELPDTGSCCPVPGEVVDGRYRVVREIGEGGMGMVYIAEQTTPVRRLIALKLLKPGLDTRRVVRRFEMERQALAMMDHPGIARVLDAGTTSGGRPFFVMDLIRGDDLATYCRESRPGLRKRLELFARVCDAVQHAHTKGVIHRDLKPSNILVSMRDGEPVPTVIDFGIAKAVSAESASVTLETQLGQRVGTAEYMSPEQLVGDPDIDTRTDVYSLGAVLYELLTGRRADRSGSGEAGAPVARPSNMRCLSGMQPSVPGEVRKDGFEAGGAPQHAHPLMPARLRGELNWIVLRALRDARDERYETVESFAADIRRFLRGEPVEAGPPSVRYRLTKFVRRNALLMGCVILVCVILLAATGVSGAMAYRERQARETASQREAQAEAASLRAERVNLFLQNMLLTAQDAGQQANTFTIRDMLIATARRLEEGVLEGQPDVEYEVRRVIANTMIELGWAEPALVHAAWIHDYVIAHFPAGDPRALDAMWLHAETLKETGNLVEALPVFESIHRIVIETLGERDGFTIRAMDEIGNTLMRMHRTDEAIAIHTRTLEMLHELHGPNDERVGLAMFNLAGAYRLSRQFEISEPLYREVITVLDASHPDGASPSAIRARQELGGIVLPGLGRTEEGRRLLEETIERSQRTLGPGHGMTAGVIETMANFCWQRGPLEDALYWTDELQGLLTELFEPDDWRSIMNLQRRAGILLALGRSQEAVSVGEQILLCLETCPNAYARHALRWGLTRADWMRVWARAAIAQGWLNQKRSDEAIGAARKLVDLCESLDLREAGSFWPLEADRLLIASSLLAGDLPALHEQRLRDLYDQLLRTRGTRDAVAARTADTLGVCLRLQGRDDEGAAFIERGGAILQNYYGSRNLQHAPSSLGSAAGVP